ncbi:hypothetical protein JVT61DRAFT_3890 [Boletus reticuloceps]|uniref:BZIP domain-containing protein n=1 Tax=Boletus reticuloceps TaxID=495285 RepID=A0A8I2YNF9_9AGAM|nr:hypothetical protein JVT61DRAFT_3890 [Boletus reticuloceps]
MNNGSSASTNATITPNTLSAIHGALPSNQYTTTTHAPATSSHLSTSVTANQDNDAAYISANNAASTAANGLYLLSQAHQELTKREEAQARANGAAAAPANGRRGTKRKSAPDRSDETHTGKHREQREYRYGSRFGRRRRGRRGRRRREEESFQLHQHQRQQSQTANGGVKTKQQKKPETEEEKRRNFLERNRQAALKCRQRKKAWLTSLQAKVEFLTTENERLTSALVSSREEISRLSALVGNTVIGPGGPMVGPGIVPPNGVVSNGQPVSMSMSMASKGGAAGGATATRASYGY